MTEAEDVLRRLCGWHDGGRRVALATVVSTWGSSPCPAGSFLAVTDRRELAGSVSGGCVEGAVIRAGLEAIADGRPRLLEYGAAGERACGVGLGCGGEIRVLVQPVDAERRALLGRLADALAARRPQALAIDLATGDAWMPGDGAAPGEDPALAAAALAGSSRLVEAARGHVFLRVFAPPVRVVLVGAVHVAQALAPMARLAGYDAVVVDPRSAFATSARFEGIPIVGAWPDEAFARLGLDRSTAVVTLAHDPKIDEPALAAALRSPAFYVGALGSARTQAGRRERLRAAGLAEADLERVHGPVGLRIGARSPGEIAAAILAEIVSCARGVRPP